jgi:hypothetical protein
MAFRSAFATPAEFGGDFAWRWRRIAAREFIPHELEYSALDNGQFIHV